MVDTEAEAVMDLERAEDALEKASSMGYLNQSHFDAVRVCEQRLAAIRASLQPV